MNKLSDTLNTEYFGKAGFSYRIRPVQKDDGERLHSLFNHLSPESRYFRFAHAISKLSDLFIKDILELDYRTEMAFVAYQLNESKIEEIIGITRYVAIDDSICEFSVSVSDSCTEQSVGRHLILQLIKHAKHQGFKKMIGYVLKTNSTMLHFIEKLHFKVNQMSHEIDFAEVSLNLD
jgi:acetyltransferase